MIPDACWVRPRRRFSPSPLYLAWLLGLLASHVVPIGCGEAAEVGRAVKADPFAIDSPERLEALRVQIILDRSGFSPGRLDGAFGQFTQKAATRYFQVRGMPPGSLVDTSAVPEPIIDYQVREADLEWIGPQRRDPAQQARLRAMNYGSLWEMIAEKFHCSEKFLRDLNAGRAPDSLRPGDWVRVPNVEPFVIEEVVAQEKARRRKRKAQPARSPGNVPLRRTPQIAEKLFPDEGTPPGMSYGLNPSARPPEIQRHPVKPADTLPPKSIAIRLRLDRSDKVIDIYRGKTLIGCLPCTPGSARIPVKLGHWKVTSNILMPHFRWDKSVLQSGVRSANSYNLPPGPNNPVGIVWMGINRRSIGIHGTNSPDQIGRNQSSGCIRTANWDAFRLSRIVEKGTEFEVVE